MNQQDFIYKAAFDYALSEGLTQKQGGDLASQALRHWRRGMTFEASMKAVKSEAKHMIALRKKQLRERTRRRA